MANHSLYRTWLMNDLTERKKISLGSILSSIEDSGIQEVKANGGEEYYLSSDDYESNQENSEVLL